MSSKKVVSIAALIVTVSIFLLFIFNRLDSLIFLILLGILAIVAFVIVPKLKG